MIDMPKFNTPKGLQGIHIGGAYFPVDKDGVLELPEEGNYTSLLPEGFTPYESPKTDGVYPPAAADPVAVVAAEPEEVVQVATQTEEVKTKSKK